MALQSTVFQASAITSALVGSGRGPATHRATSVSSFARLSSGGISAPSAILKVLEEKSVGELRQLAKERGLRGDTKSELIKLLASSPLPSSAASTPATGPSAATPVGLALNAASLERMSVSELRAIARSRGLLANTKKDLIAELIKYSSATPSPAAVTSPSESTVSSSPVVVPSSPSALEKRLKAKPLSKLRAMARQKGLKGESKEALVQAFLALSAGTTTSVTTADSSAPVVSSSDPVPASPLRAQLQTKPISLLRAMARQKGLKGETKEQLIAALLGEPTSSSSGPVLTEAILASKTVGELRALAKEKGVRGDTKGELIKLLLTSQ